MVYAAMFGVGKLCLAAWGSGAALLAASLACGAYLYADISRRTRPVPQAAATGRPAG
jgi:hypothetical protein